MSVFEFKLLPSLRQYQHCYLCGISRTLADIDHGLCEYCEERIFTKLVICPCCIRKVDHIFCCSWCGSKVCDLCVLNEHDFDSSCRDPDDYDWYDFNDEE